MFDELAYGEVIDPVTGELLPDGERGELVLTHLRKEAQPLLRYRTGDLTAKRMTEPVCGRRTSLPKVVFGRTDDMIKAKGVKVYPSEIRTVLLGLDGLTGRYRMKVAPGDRIALALEGSGGDEAAEEVARRFKSQVLISVDEIAFVEELGDGPVAVDERRAGGR